MAALSYSVCEKGKKGRESRKKEKIRGCIKGEKKRKKKIERRVRENKKEK